MCAAFHKTLVPAALKSNSILRGNYHKEHAIFHLKKKTFCLEKFFVQWKQILLYKEFTWLKKGPDPFHLLWLINYTLLFPLNFYVFPLLSH